MKKLLVVIDMQNDFIDGSLGSKDAQAIVPNVVEKIKNFDGYIAFTQDTHQESYLETTLEGKMLPVKHCIVDSNGESTKGHQINEDVLIAACKFTDDFFKKKEILVDAVDYIDDYDAANKFLKKLKRSTNMPPLFFVPKPTFGCVILPMMIQKFEEDWQKTLNDLTFKFDEIQICGLCTDICVVSNALLLRAFFPNMPIKVISSCCAGTSPEAHEAALKVMKSCQIEVI